MNPRRLRDAFIDLFPEYASKIKDYKSVTPHQIWIDLENGRVIIFFFIGENQWYMENYPSGSIVKKRYKELAGAMESR